MMRSKKVSRYLTVLMIVLAVTLFASVDTAAKNKRMPKVYMFGVAASFNDSTVYFTDIQEIDSVWINDKTDFLVNRSEYSYRLRNYLDARGDNHYTCIVSYALKRKDIEKKYNKTRNKYVKRGGCDLKLISGGEFEFKPVGVEE